MSISAERTFKSNMQASKVDNDTGLVTEDDDSDEYMRTRCVNCGKSIREPETSDKENIGKNKPFLCEDCHKKRTTNEESKSIKYIFVSAVLLFFGIFGAYVYYEPKFSFIDAIECENEDVILNELKKVKDKFPSQDKDIFYTFLAGIHRIYVSDPTEPTSFLLFHNSKDKNVANCLASEVSKLAAKCLTGTDNVIRLFGGDLRKDEKFLKDSGELIATYGEKVNETHVMVVNDLNQIPGNIVKEFHYFCDTYQPLVNKAVYFFIMSTDNYLNESKLMSLIYKNFKMLWGDSLKSDQLEPLITRMTTNVVPVVSEVDYVKTNC